MPVEIPNVSPDSLSILVDGSQSERDELLKDFKQAMIDELNAANTASQSETVFSDSNVKIEVWIDGVKVDTIRRRLLGDPVIELRVVYSIDSGMTTTPDAVTNEETNANVILGSNSTFLIIFALFVLIFGLFLGIVCHVCWMRMRRKGAMERDSNESG